MQTADSCRPRPYMRCRQSRIADRAVEDSLIYREDLNYRLGFIACRPLFERLSPWIGRSDPHHLAVGMIKRPIPRLMKTAFMSALLLLPLQFVL